MFPIFDTSMMQLNPINLRKSNLGLSDILSLEPKKIIHKNFESIAHCIVQAKKKNSPVLMMMGAHVLRSGVQRYLIDFMEQGYISCIAMNGACTIHDFEFALIGRTTESVDKYIKDGRFGNWEETSLINDIVRQGAEEGLGLGEAMGKAIEQSDFPNKDISVLAAGYRLGVPLTVHVGIGYDITHQHPNFDGAAYGLASYVDFLRFAKILEKLKGGVVMNFGSAVMAPEVFLKALSMARNVSRQRGQSISNFTTLVCDLHSLPADYRDEAPKEGEGYYFRPWKTMLIRTVADGGKSYYVRGTHAETIPALWTAINAEQKKQDKR
jgi:hypothetical protein